MPEYRDDRRALQQQRDLQHELARAEQQAPPPQTVRCIQCGHHNAPHYKFCLGCGIDLSIESDMRLTAPLYGGPPPRDAVPIRPQRDTLDTVSPQPHDHGRTIVLVAIAAIVVAAGAVLVLVLLG